MGRISGINFFLKQFPFFYPRRIVGSCREWIDKQGKQKGVYFSQRGPWYQTIIEGGTFIHEAPQTFGKPNDKAFYVNRCYLVSEATLFYLQNCYLVGHKGLVLSAKNEVFQEFSHHFNIASLKKFLFRNPFYTFSGQIKKISGVGVVLISPESNNYYHWLSDVLPRIRLYEQVLGLADHFCISSNVPAKFLDVLGDFGVPKRKILLVNDGEKLQFDHLYVASLPGSEGRAPKWAVDFVREKLVKITDLQADKKLYFKRGQNAGRKILNENTIISMLQKQGFVVVDPGQLTVHEQVSLMQEAKIVIGAHGAALSNLLFCRDNTAVIELFSPEYFRTDCFFTLAAIRKLNYWYIAGDKPPGSEWGDFTIDEQLIFATLKCING